MQSSDANYQLATAVEAARLAGRFLLDRFGTVLNIRHKGEVDLVTEADEGAERLIIEEIRRRFPRDRILAEEGGGADGGEGTRLWVVDPLDGTTNFAHGYPVFAVSIALEVDGGLALGVVYAPALDELFVAESGRGATLNGKTLHVSTTTELGQSLICTGFSYDRAAARAALPLFGQVALRAQGIRRDGAAAVDLCFVAMGRFDGFWEQGLQPWDVAAGALVLTEAGGKLTDYSGGPFDIRGDEVVASNGTIHRELLDALAPPSGESAIVTR